MNIRFAIAAATAAAIGGLVIASSADAQSTTGAPSAQVRYGDLNMSSPQGRNALARRIYSAAQFVCGADEGVTDLYTRSATVACVQRATSDAQKAFEARTGVTIASR